MKTLLSLCTLLFATLTYAADTSNDIFIDGKAQKVPDYFKLTCNSKIVTVGDNSFIPIEKGLSCIVGKIAPNDPDLAKMGLFLGSDKDSSGKKQIVCDEVYIKSNSVFCRAEGSSTEVPARLLNRDLECRPGIYKYPAGSFSILHSRTTTCEATFSDSFRDPRMECSGYTIEKNGIGCNRGERVNLTRKAWEEDLLGKMQAMITQTGDQVTCNAYRKYEMKKDNKKKDQGKYLLYAECCLSEACRVLTGTLNSQQGKP